MINKQTCQLKTGVKKLKNSCHPVLSLSWMLLELLCCLSFLRAWKLFLFHVYLLTGLLTRLNMFIKCINRIKCVFVFHTHNVFYLLIWLLSVSSSFIPLCEIKKRCSHFSRLSFKYTVSRDYMAYMMHKPLVPRRILHNYLLFCRTVFTEPKLLFTHMILISWSKR